MENKTNGLLTQREMMDMFVRDKMREQEMKKEKENKIKKGNN